MRTTTEPGDAKQQKDELECLMRRAGLPARQTEIDALLEVYPHARAMADQMYAVDVDGPLT